MNQAFMAAILIDLALLAKENSNKAYSMFFMFSSLDKRVDITNLPKFHDVIKNVSKFGDNYDLVAIEKDPKKATEQIYMTKTQQREKVLQRYKKQQSLVYLRPETVV